MFIFTSAGLTLFILLSLSSLVYSSPLPDNDELVVHRQIKQVPPAYAKVGKPTPDQIIEVAIGLVSPKMGRLEAKLYEISNPNHKDYGKHLTKQETEDLVRPDTNVTTAVNKWLSRNNVSPTSTTPSGHRLYVKMSIAEAERMLNTTFGTYNHIPTNTTIIRTTQYSVPGSLNNDITFMHPIISFPSNPSPRRARSKTVPSANTTTITRRDGPCNSQDITVNCVMEMYHIPADTGVPRTHDQVLILSFVGQTVLGPDVAIFMKEFRPDVSLSDVQLGIVSVDGGDNPQGPGVSAGSAFEADVDVQMVTGTSPKSQVTVLTTGNSSTGFLKSFDSVLSQDNMATVVSMSYYQDELVGDDGEGAVGIDYMISVCEDIMRLTARGTTVVIASGDGGVSGGQFGGTTCTTFHAVFPTSCPFALSVGATQISSDGSETAAAFSSGGFSDVFSMPSYQTAAVSNYLSQLGSVNSDLYNSTGRGFPDISAIGVSMSTINEGSVKFDGTSISAPLVAGTLAAINDVRRANGKSPMGFIHPWLYANPAAVTDITQGSNPGCNTSGFPAAGGWDPVTGLGTLLFDQLLTMP